MGEQLPLDALEDMVAWTEDMPLWAPTASTG
jgi:hypothetical protein